MHSALNVDDSGGGQAHGKPLFSKDEIKALFAGMAVRFDPGGFELCWALACLPGYGCLRTVRRVVQLLVKQKPDEVITRKRILQALPLLFAEVGVRMTRLAERHCSAAKKAA